MPNRKVEALHKRHDVDAIVDDWTHKTSRLLAGIASGKVKYAITLAFWESGKVELLDRGEIPHDSHLPLATVQLMIQQLTAVQAVLKRKRR